MSAVRASLVVPVFRGWDHAAALLESVGPPPAWLEVVVVDDAGGDDGAVAFAQRFPHVVAIVRRRNGGFAAAVNTGVDAAHGSVVVVANSDLLLSGAALRALVEAVEQTPDVVLAPRTRTPQGHEVAVGHRFPTPLGDAAELYVPYRAARRLSRAVAGRLHRTTGRRYCDWVLGSCLAFSREFWLRAGPLDEHYGMYSEEVDWQRRAAAYGLRAAVFRDALAVHDETHGADPGGARVDERFRAVWRARLRYHRRHAGTGAVERLRLLWVGGFAVSAPAWLALAAVPRFRRRALAELRRSAWLARAGLEGGSL